jgi:DNA-binding NtrC family response regulator
MSKDLENYATSAEVPVLEQCVLIIEDEAVFAKAVAKRLARAGYKSAIAGTLRDALEQYRELAPDLILLDMRLPDGSGLDFLAKLREQHGAGTAVLVLSAYGELEDAVAAMKLSAADYLKKPIDLEELVVNVEKVLARAALDRKLDYSTKRERHATETVEFLGDCLAIRNLREQALRIGKLTRSSASSVPPTVLILGETGTGKDVLARLLHASSALDDRPFVHVDCASLPKDLIEAELFGHEKGAFTSAHVSRTGLIEAAEDGMLFLDEIGEIPLDLQSKLLAVLERRIVRRVGTTQERPVAAWFVAATNRDIEALARQGAFRSDLYFRLNVLSLSLPPLRERGDDILLLARHFATQTARRYGFTTVMLTAQAERLLREYHWPGNVRELRHIIERAVLLTGGGALDARDLGLASGTPAAVEGSGWPEDLTLDEAERMLIQRALERTGGNVSQAARRLGVTRMALRYRMQKHGLKA